MERMTRWNPETEEAECEIDGVVHTGSITTRLAEYEDTGLEPEQCAKYAQAEKDGRYIVLKEPRSAGVHRLEEIARADIEGRLVVLPCKVGGKVFRASWPSGDCVTEIKINRRGYHFKCWWGWFHKKDIGKTVFLTREDAEKALGGRMNERTW